MAMYDPNKPGGIAQWGPQQGGGGYTPGAAGMNPNAKPTWDRRQVGPPTFGGNGGPGGGDVPPFGPGGGAVGPVGPPQLQPSPPPSSGTAPGGSLGSGGGSAAPGPVSTTPPPTPVRMPPLQPPTAAPPVQATPPAQANMGAQMPPMTPPVRAPQPPARQPLPPFRVPASSPAQPGMTYSTSGASTGPVMGQPLQPPSDAREQALAALRSRGMGPEVASNFGGQRGR